MAALIRAPQPLLAKLGERVRIRFGNLSAMNHHPIHIHGHGWKIIETDGGPIPEEGQWPEVDGSCSGGQPRGRSSLLPITQAIGRCTAT